MIRHQNNPSFRPRNLNQVHNQQDSKPSTSTSITFDQIAPTQSDPGSDPNQQTQSAFEYVRSLPPGYRFVPTDCELICDYLQPKIAGERLPPCLIHSVELYRFHPKSLAERYLKHPDGEEVYVFTPRNRKYKNGKRPTRTVEGIGYWKATGADKKIRLRDEVIGFMRSLVFYEGKAPNGDKTNWIMHEFRVPGSRKRTSNDDMKLDDWVLCRIREKNETAPSKAKDKDEGVDANTNTNNISDSTDTKVNADIDANDVNNFPDNVVLTDGSNIITEDHVARASVNTSYRHELDQLDELQMPWSSDVPSMTDPYLFDVNDNYTLPGSFPSYDDHAMTCVPGPSYANELLITNNGFDSDGHDCWGMRNNNGFDDYLSTGYACSYNFQGNSSGLGINTGNDEKRTKVEKN